MVPATSIRQTNTAKLQNELIKIHFERVNTFLFLQSKLSRKVATRTMQTATLQLSVWIIVLCGFVSAEDWNVQFFPKDVECFMGRSVQVNATIKSTKSAVSDFVFASEFSALAQVHQNISLDDFNSKGLQWKGVLDIDCHLLGMTDIYVEYEAAKSHNQLKVIIIKEMKLLDNLFSATIALVITFLYINFGAALDFEVLKGILKKPVGPLIGFFCQYILMPLLGFALGYLIFPDQVHFRLGLFFTAVAPGGGMSNILTVVLNGNINLSIAMTTISNIAALWMMPLWIFTLGARIFDDFNFDVPYTTIILFCCSMVIPLCIGMAVQKHIPSVARVLVRILKPASIILMLSIVAVAVWLDFYMFQLFTCEVGSWL